MFLRNLPFYLILLLLDIPSISASGFVSRALQRAQHAAALHTRSLARDLRITFGSVLVSQDGPGSSQNNHVVYCKVPSGLRTSGDRESDDDFGGDRPTSSSAMSDGPTRTRSSTASQPPPTKVSTPWKLQDVHAGRTFFDQWDWHVGGDPTFGIVDYIGADAARGEGLVSVNDAGNAIMRLETTERVPANRRSVRIHSKKIYNGGMFVLDALHMPYGCGTWPAFWTNGPDWPNNGEIDILEGVHDYSNNQATLHTRSGCSIPSRDNNVVGMKGSVLNTNCGTRESGNQACGTRSSSNKSLGVNFNRNGGGVYVMTWDEDGIANYFFEPENIPSDLLAETPLPSTWGLPQARWPASTCAPFEFFRNHIMIFDTTLCGQWAGAVWNVGGIPGQEESCAARTGYPTCEEFVRNNGHTLQDAYWEVKSVKVYIKS